MGFIDNMWENHRAVAITLGVLLFPIAIAIIVLKVMSSANVAGAKASIEKAQATDNKLASQEDELKKQAAAQVAVADQAAQRIEDRHADDVTPDLDWQNKRKD